MDNPKRIKDVMELYLGHLIAYERSRMVEDMRNPSPFANVSDSGLEGGRKSPLARDSPLGMDFGGGINRDNTPQDEDGNSAEQGPDNGLNNHEPEHPFDHTPSPAKRPLRTPTSLLRIAIRGWTMAVMDMGLRKTH
ncbi:hypothetical protein G7054_g1409 [Neopestalotiopsis clavispora]|nr:hypothetical protein G7054_g1409 [Neopestalotiopsis clavispora]